MMVGASQNMNVDEGLKDPRGQNGTTGSDSKRVGSAA
jgi:hypothetical protein